jgi:hypothetical protein
MLGLGETRLSIYLNDHLAGATGAVNIARRSAASNRDPPSGAALEELAREIDEDRSTLITVMDRLSVGRDQLKLALAWGAERAGRLKLNGSLVGYSPLSRLEELEALLAGVNGKLALWETLQRTHGHDTRLRDVDLDALLERARSQRRRLHGQHEKAAGQAFA